ncbi:MAG: GGDEF domain-containing protein, partial [Candidatus Hydrogenedentota bacterium]
TGAFSRLAWDLWGTHIKGVCHLAVDLDGFKLVNDLYGHPAGDSVLARVSDILTRHDSRVFRLGGDEFVILAPPYDKTLRRMANEIVAEVASAALGVTASVGIGPSYESADAALYEAKRAGKNRVVVAGGGHA